MSVPNSPTDLVFFRSSSSASLDPNSPTRFSARPLTSPTPFIRTTTLPQALLAKRVAEAYKHGSVDSWSLVKRFWESQESKAIYPHYFQQFFQLEAVEMQQAIQSEAFSKLYAVMSVYLLC